MRQPHVQAEHPLPRPRASGERMRRGMPRALELCRRGGHAELHAGPLDQIGEAPPIGFQTRGRQLEQERRGRRPSPVDARRIRVDPHRRLLHEAHPERAEVGQRRGPADGLVVASLVVGVEQRLQVDATTLRAPRGREQGDQRDYGARASGHSFV